MRLPAATVAVALALCAPAAQSLANPANYGIESVAGSLSKSQAGAHADFANDLVLKTESFELPALTRDVTIELPAGLLANPDSAPKCTTTQFIGTNVEVKSNATGCPQDSQVGVTHIVFASAGLGTSSFVEPVFNLMPRPGEPARLGFIALAYPIVIDTELRAGGDEPYGVTAMVRGTDTLATLYETETTLWSVPADESHDGERMTPYESAHNSGAIETPTGRRTSGLTPTPFTLNPTRCAEPFPLHAAVDSYQEPGRLSRASTMLPAATGCSLLEFKPTLTITPTTEQAQTGTGLDATLTFPTAGLQQPNLNGEDEQKRVEVALPEGVTVNPSQANGLGACSEVQFEAETASSGVGTGCPQSSKVGTVIAKSPLIDEKAEGSIYIAEPYRNPYGTLIAIYMILKIPDRGVIVKLPGKVELGAQTGQLRASFGDGAFPIPQLPVESFHLHFREGARAPLVTPAACGRYESTAHFESWGGHTVTTHPSFEIGTGNGGGPCQRGPQPFRPGFMAGTISNQAGTYSPFHMRLTRGDGEQEMTRFSSILPPGVVGRIAGIPYCPEVAIALAQSRSGVLGGSAELEDPSCPAASRIGRTDAGAGVGSSLTWVGGSLYLAGPYRDDPLSVVSITPAVAGPFDIGTVVVREGLALDPTTGEVEVDGAASDPIPRILQGIPLELRDLRVKADRPRFTLNATNCEPELARAILWGGGTVLAPSAEMPINLSARYQAAGCRALGLKPRLGFKLRGGTRRGAHPGLLSVLRTRPGDTNIDKVVVTLPHSAFLEQGHIRTVCTRVQFRAKTCPAGSIYGHARAVTPLLDEPLKGPVYLRSSNHKLPDLVVALRGVVDIDLVGQIDSLQGRIRTTFKSVPDAPVSKFVLAMQGGAKGLIVNSRSLCASPSRAQVKFTGQNGKVRNFNPTARAKCDEHRRRTSHH